MTRESPEPEFDFFVISGVGGAEEGAIRPFVDVTIRGQRMQVPPEKAREIGMMMLECAEAADSDATTVEFMETHVGMNRKDATRVLIEHRDIRDRRRTERMGRANG